MKKNNKGYLIVEVIVASVLALLLAYFLINLTLTVKSKNDDAYNETIYISDKAVMTKTVMEDLIKSNIKSVNNCTYSNVACVDFVSADGVTKRMRVDKLTGFFEYGTYANGKYNLSDYYSANFSEKLVIGDVRINTVVTTGTNGTKNTLLTVEVPATNIYLNKDYGIKAVVRY